MSQALDGRSICESNAWESYLDDLGRTVVRSECVFKGSRDFYANKREKSIETIKQSNEAFVASSQNEIDEYREKIKVYSNKVAEIESGERLNGFISKYDQLPVDGDSSSASGSAPREIAASVLLGVEGMKPSDDGYLEFFASKEFDSLVRLPVSYELDGAKELDSISSSFRYFQGQYFNLKKRTNGDEYEQYKLNNLSGYLKDYAQLLPAIEAYCRALIASEDSRLAEKKSSDVSQYKENLNSELVFLREDISKYEAAIKDISERMIRVENDKVDPAQAALSRYPVFESMAERFYWVVNKDLEVVLVGAELLGLGKNDDSNKVLANYGDPSGRLVLVSQGQLNDYSRYLLSLDLM